MKLRHFIWLPLATLLLNSCDLLAKKVTKEEAIEKVEAAYEKMEETELQSYEHTLINTEETTDKTFVDGKLTETEVFTMKDKSVVKGRELLTLNPEFSTLYELNVLDKVNGEEVEFEELKEETHYQDEWFYVNYHRIYRGEFGDDNEDTKLKYNVGRPDLSAIGFINFIANEVSEAPHFPAGLAVDSLTNTYHLCSSITMKDLFGTVTITAKLTTRDFIRTLIGAFGGYDLLNLTSEEAEALEEAVDEAMAENGDQIVVKKGNFITEINKDGFISAIKQELEMKTRVYDEDEVLLTEATLKMVLDFKVKFNEKVTINFPNFADYQLGEPA